MGKKKDALRDAKKSALQQMIDALAVEVADLRTRMQMVERRTFDAEHAGHTATANDAVPAFAGN